MAILKHIKSRNANYSTAIDYLLFQHDEKTGKKLKTILEEICSEKNSIWMDLTVIRCLLTKNVNSQISNSIKIRSSPKSKAMILK